MENLENLRIIVNAWCIGSVVGFNYVCLPAESLSEVVLLPTVGVDVYGQSQPGYHRISHVCSCFSGNWQRTVLAITQIGMYHCYLNMGPNPNTLLFTLHSNWYVYDCIDIVYEYDYSILYYTTTSGWWFGTCFIFSIQLGIIIQTDELIFFRGVGQPPTRLHYHMGMGQNLLLPYWGNTHSLAGYFRVPMVPGFWGIAIWIPWSKPHEIPW